MFSNIANTTTKINSKPGLIGIFFSSNMPTYLKHVFIVKQNLKTVGHHLLL